MFKKMVMVLVVVAVMVLFSVTADANPVFDGAVVKYNAKDYAGALTDFQTVLKSTTVEMEKSNIRLWMAHCYAQEGNVQSANAEYNTILDTAGGNLAVKSYAQMEKTFQVFIAKDYDTAITEFGKVSNDSPEAKSLSLLSIGECYDAKGDKIKTQEAYLQVCNSGGNIKYFKTAFDRVDPTFVGEEAYVKYLKNLRAAVNISIEEATSTDPTVMASVKAKTDFLGIVKFNIDKYK